MVYHLLATIEAPRSRELVRWLLHLGGAGLIPLGILDNSLVPVPGSMDVATILLAARDRELWFYYALMATAGSVLGGLLTYRLARRGGKAAMEKKLSAKNARKVQKRFERWGFAAIFVPAMLPPPLPMVPFLIAAGALQYPLTKFLLALTLGRLARYFILASLGVQYGRQITSLLSHHSHLILYVGIAASVAGAVLALLLRARSKKRRPKANPETRKAA